MSHRILSDQTALPTLLMIGAGRMGRALLAGWRDAGLLEQSRPEVAVRGAEAAGALERDFGIAAFTDIADATPAPEMLLLAVKPQQLAGVLDGLPGGLLGPDTLVVSIAAGVTLGALAAHLPAGRPILRVMPNTPARVRQGLFGCIGNAAAAAHRARAEALFAPLGEMVWLDSEDQMHGFTALAGSGPAYLFAVIEALAKAALAEGLPAGEAGRIAAATVAGAGALALADSRPARALRDEVASPGGTTEAGLRVLEDGGFERLLEGAVRAASERSKQLAGQ